MKKLIRISILVIFLLSIRSYNVYANDMENETEIQEGIYQIGTSLNKEQVVEITGRSRDSGVKAELWKNKSGANQKFKIEKTTDGYYKIISLNSLKALTVNGTSVEQQDFKNNNNQKWKIKKDSKGYYYFISANNGMYLQTNGQEGNKIAVNKKNSENTQKFILKQISNLENERIADGYYTINSTLNKNKVLDINGISKDDGANVQIWSKNKGSNQIFKIKYNETGFYWITAVLSEKTIETTYVGHNGNNVRLNSFKELDEQKWLINKTKDGNYNIISVANGLVLNIDGGKINDGTNINVYTSNNTSSQKFQFEKVDIPTSNQTVDNGFYEISIQSDNKKVMDINGNTVEQKAIAQLWENKNGPNQRFKVKYNSDGYYTLTPVNSNLALELSGIKIWQWEKNNSKIQDWILKSAGNGYYYIISACNGLYLTQEDSNLRMREKNDKVIQKFKFNKIANLTGSKTIPDGYYIIESIIDSNKVVDVNGASIYAEENVQLWTKKERNNQKFKFKYDGNGYYTITNVRSKKVLDVAWHKKTNGSNVQQYYSKNTDWQKWIVEKTSDGYYNIISKDSGLYLNIAGEKAIDGANIELYTKNNKKSQKFKLNQTTGVEGVKTIQDGYYKIKSKLDTNKVLDIGNLSKENHANIALWTSNQGYNQKYKITYRENGFYTITVAHSGKAMDLSSNNKNVEQDNVTNSEEQEWVITSKGNGGYNIISAHNGLYLDIENEKAIDGANVQVSNKNNANNQVFLFDSTIVEEGKQTISNGTYHIASYLDNSKILDVTGESKENGTNIELWQNKEGDNQNFKIIYQGNGYYKIIAMHSSKAIGVVGAGNSAPVNVNQYDIQDTLKQEWIIKECGNGYYNIVSRCNGLYLESSNASTQNGANIEVSNKNNQNSQKFKFIKPKEKIRLQSGTYGSSGLKIKGDSRGSYLQYYKIGNGPNVFFGTFAVHGWEDLYDNDGKALTQIAEDFKNKLIEIQDYNLADRWTIYIFPSVNPDGEYYGYTHNGPGRTTLYSATSSHKGIDINRSWSTGYTKYKTDRNYNGTEPFQAYESRALRDFLLSHKATKGQTILVDLHGWLNETVGDDGIGSYYRNQIGMTKHIATYGRGYLINWAQANLGANGRTARSCLVELPEYQADSTKYINATLNMLRSIN